MYLAYFRINMSVGVLDIHYPLCTTWKISCFIIWPGGILFLIAYALVTNSKEFSFIKY